MSRKDCERAVNTARHAAMIPADAREISAAAAAESTAFLAPTDPIEPFAK